VKRERGVQIPSARSGSSVGMSARLERQEIGGSTPPLTAVFSNLVRVGIVRHRVPGIVKYQWLDRGFDGKDCEN
jgi:hypothetical protein